MRYRMARSGVPVVGIMCISCGWVFACAAIPPNSFFDPTSVGQFPFGDRYTENEIRRVLTPRETPPGIANASDPIPDDLVALYDDYRIGPGDAVALQIQDLIVQGLEYQALLEVSPTGYIRLPQIGQVKVGGLTEPEMEEELSNRLKEAQILPNPVIQAFVQTRRHRIFTILGSVAAAGFYPITIPDLRLLDAIGLARDIGPEVRKLYVIRQNKSGTSGLIESIEQSPRNNGIIVQPPDESRGPSFLTQGGGGAVQQRNGQTPRTTTIDELDALLAPPERPMTSEPRKPFEPIVLEPRMDAPSRPARNQQQPNQQAAPKSPSGPFDWDEVPELELAQRVIEIDVAALRNGDPRYNIVIRDRDIIQVPVDTGVFYLMGEINRPGVYGFGGREITVKQAVALGGGFGQLAWPQRCEIIRREPGTDKQLTIPVDVDAIFAGLKPDVLLRNDDILNVGTHVAAPFLFVLRNSFRFTYGFGFVYDRNFADQDSYGPRQNPEFSNQIRRSQRGLPF